MKDTPLIFGLLPNLYRRRDTDGALHALTSILDDTRSMMERDVDALYRDWFVGTCDPAALPLLGTLVGLETLPDGAAHSRALVADAVSLARRKGTYPATARSLELLGGWPAIVSPNPEADGSVVVEIWRRSTDRLIDVSPCRAQDGGPGCFRFHPLGIDCRLMAIPRPFRGLHAVPDRRYDAPVPLEESADFKTSVDVHLRDRDGRWRTVAADRTALGDLAAWAARADEDADDGPWAIVDPVLGRLYVTGFHGAPDDILVRFAYAGPGAIGGGGYDRPNAAAAEGMWIGHVAQNAVASPDAKPPRFGSLAEALAAWRSVPGDGIIRLMDSGTQTMGDLLIDDGVHACARDPNRVRTLTIEAPGGDVAVLRGDITVRGNGVGVDITLRGLWIDGRLTIGANASVRVEHCSLWPNVGDRHNPAIVVRGSTDADAGLAIRKSIVGPIVIGRHGKLVGEGSVVNGMAGRLAISGDGDATLTTATILGDVNTRQVEADRTIFDGTVVAERGTVRRSTLAAGSRVPDMIDCHARAIDARPVNDPDGEQTIGAFASDDAGQRRSLVIAAIETLLPIGTTVSHLHFR